MSKFSDKLKSYINEVAATTFINNQISINGSENDDASIIASAGPLYGLRLIKNEDGVLSFVTYSKVAVEQFTKYLDESDAVDVYDISITVTDPFTKVGEVDNEFDFESLRESEFIEFNIDVALVSALIDYDAFYADEDNSEYTSDPIPFEYSDDEVGDEDDNQESQFYDYIGQDETPVLINVSSAESASPYGSFMVTVHPDDNGKILIQCNYETDPLKDDVEHDLNIINNGLFGPTFLQQFKLVSSAKYIEGSLATSAAVYDAINTDDAISVVESFEHINYIKSDRLDEIEKIIKVNFRGKRRFKMQCKKGYKYDVTRKACVLITGAQLATSRIAHRQMARTKKSLGSGYKTRIVRKMKRAQRFRKLMGI